MRDCIKNLTQMTTNKEYIFFGQSQNEGDDLMLNVIHTKIISLFWHKNNEIIIYPKNVIQEEKACALTIKINLHSTIVGQIIKRKNR